MCIASYKVKIQSDFILPVENFEDAMHITRRGGLKWKNNLTILPRKGQRL